MRTPLETNIRYLPIAYRVSIERLDASAERRRNEALAELRQWCDAYAVTYGIDLASDEHKHFVESACAIATRRFPMTPVPYTCGLCWQVITDGKECGCGARR